MFIFWRCLTMLWIYLQEKKKQKSKKNEGKIWKISISNMEKWTMDWSSGTVSELVNMIFRCSILSSSLALYVDSSEISWDEVGKCQKINIYIYLSTFRLLWMKTRQLMMQQLWYSFHATRQPFWTHHSWCKKNESLRTR